MSRLRGEGKRRLRRLGDDDSMMRRLRRYRGHGAGGIQGRTKDEWHALWETAAHPDYGHFDLGRGGFDMPPAVDSDPSEGIAMIPTGGTDGSRQNRVDYWVNQPEDLEAIPPDPGFNSGAPLFPNRRGELDALHQAGNLAMSVATLDAQMVANLHVDTVFEPRWRFDGMAPNTDWEVGPAWSVFRYTISDLFVGGHMSGVDLIVTLRDILEDIKDLTGGIVTDRSVFLIKFQSDNTDGSQGNKPILYHVRRGETIGDALDDQLEGVLNSIQQGFSQASESDEHFNFWFYRVFVAIITNLPGAGGGSLLYMPADLKKMRGGPFYKGKKGYVCVEDDADRNCGLVALLVGLANVTSRIKKACKMTGELAPSLCNDLLNFREKLKRRSQVAEKLRLQMLYEMASSVGWKSGTNLTPEQLCQVIRFVNDKYKLDIGLLVMDAIHPLHEVVVSYDTDTKKLPKEKICLVHWKYPGEGGRADGHYDCIYPTNLVTWIQKSIEKRNHLVFCFRTLKLVRNNEGLEKGELCQNCNYWESEIDAKKWYTDHKFLSQDMETYMKCENCQVEFKGEDCYEKHFLPSHGLAKPQCENRQVCDKCKTVHLVTYECEFFFCIICKTKGLKKDRKNHVCYIQHVGNKKQGVVQNVVYSDCEGSRADGYHRAVCIASAWKQLCVEHTKYLKKNKCEVCKLGYQQFSPFCVNCGVESGYDTCGICQKNNHNVFYDESCIMDYLGWLEGQFKKCTVVFHNGGRYDLHLIYLELLKSGRYFVKKEAERGTQIIFMTAGLITEERLEKKIEFRFIDSFNYIHFSLRAFPSMFNIDEKNFSKGRFPYELLNTPGWREYEGECPEYKYFGITDKEWNNEEKLNKNRRREVGEIKEYIQENKENKKWGAFEKLMLYVVQDVFVLQAGCEEFRASYWGLTGADPFHWVTLPSAVAGTFRLGKYMKPDSIQVFGMEVREWQRECLRGGRCEPFKLYWRAQSEEEELKLYDVNSEYPAAQIYGYAPYGKVTMDKNYTDPKSFKLVAKEFKLLTGKNLVDVLHDSSGASGNGMIECVVEAAYTKYPILPCKLKRKTYTKNLFMVRSGKWSGFISVLAEAIVHQQVIVTMIKRIQFWNTTSDKIFRKFLSPLYAAKVEATGWKKTLGKDNPSQEEKDEFILESKYRKIPIVEEKMADNPGVRSTSKLIINCGWGYLCQKPHANSIVYYDNENPEEVVKMADVLLNLDSEKDSRKLMGIPKAIGRYTRMKLQKDPLDILPKEMNANIAYHVGGCAPAWGLQLVSRTLLTLHSNQPVYCDTDSLFFVYHKTKIERGVYKDIPTGPYLGDFVDEHPGKRIVEFVSIGPKSYFLKLVDRKTGKTEYIGKFKGLPYMSGSYSMLDDKEELASLGMEEMKKILFSAYSTDTEEGDEKIESLCMKFQYTNFFKRSHDFKIRENKESKTLRFTFDKRKVIWPKQNQKLEDCFEINTDPFIDTESERTSEEIGLWWDDMRDKINAL